MIFSIGCPNNKSGGSVLGSYVIQIGATLLMLLALLNLLSCSGSDDENDEGSVVGYAMRSGSTDHSGITVSLFGVVSTDPDISQILNQYPNIGFTPSQSCLFDHRYHTAIRTVTTDNDGRFGFDNLTQADYNVVVEDSGYGCRYALRMQVRGGETRTDTLILYPIEQPPQNITQNTTWESGHHYRITQNTTVGSGVQLTIEPGVTISFTHSKKIEIWGTLTAIGQSDQFIRWIRDSTSIVWNQVSLRSTSAALNQVSWCLFDGGTIGIVNDGSTLSIQKSYFNNCSLFGASFTNVSNVDVDNCIFVDQLTGSGLDCRDVTGGYVSFNLFTNNQKGINCPESSFLTIENNWIGHSYGAESSAIFMQDINSNSGDSLIITHNQIEDCVWGIWISGGVRTCTAIRYNNIDNCTQRGIRIVPETLGNPSPVIHRNNLTNIDYYYIELNRIVSQVDVDARWNWWGTTNSNIIEQNYILDGRDPGMNGIGYVLYEPFLTTPESSAGIQ